MGILSCVEDTSPATNLIKKAALIPEFTQSQPQFTFCIGLDEDSETPASLPLTIQR